MKMLFAKVVKYKGEIQVANVMFEVDDADVESLKFSGGWVVEPPKSEPITPSKPVPVPLVKSKPGPQAKVVKAEVKEVEEAEEKEVE